MKDLLRKLFWPILCLFEKGDEPYVYKALNRKVLLVVGVLFTGLSLGILYMSSSSEDLGYLISFIVFFGAGLVCFVVGGLGNERAVAKIWGNH